MIWRGTAGRRIGTVLRESECQRDIEERLIRVVEEGGAADGFNVCGSVQISFGHRVTPWFEVP